MKKKKRNPSFLDWIFDFFVQPIANGIKRIIDNPLEAIKLSAPVTAIHDLIRIVAPSIDTIEADIVPAKIRTPEDADKVASGLVTEADESLENLTTATMVIEAATFGLVDVTIDRAARLPAPRFLDTISTGVREARLNAGFLQFYQRYLLKQYKPLLPEPYRLALARSKGWLTDATYRTSMNEQGYTDFWASVWKSENWIYPAVEIILALLRRGDIDESLFRGWLERSGLPAETWMPLLDLKTVIPPITDLIRFAVREAYGTHTFEEQYPTYEFWATKMGLTKEMTGWYWYAHWDRIPLAQLYDNLYRKDKWADEFMAYLRLKDVHPDDRQLIMDVAYRPPTIREMGYGYDVGAYTKEDIKRYRRWGGLSPEDADKAATALIDYRLSAEREAVRRELLWLFSHNKIEEAEFVNSLKTVMEIKELIPLWVERGKLQRERYLKPPTELEYAIPTGSEARWAFEHRLKDETWLRKTLADLDWDKSRIDLAVESSKQRIKERLKPPEEEKFRDLSVTQIRDLWRIGKITEEEIPAYLVLIGYAPEDVELIAQLLTFVPEKALEPRMLSRTDVTRMYDMRVFDEKQVSNYYEKIGYTPEDAYALTLWTKISVEFPDLRAMYRNGWITSQQLIDGLKALGLSEERAIDYALTVIKYDQPSRVEKERDLTKSEILKGRTKGILDTNQAVDLLLDIGYDENEAYYLLALQDIIVVRDPQGYWQMKRAVEQLKKARGEPAKDIPQEVVDLEIMINDIKADIEKKRAEGVSAEEIAEDVKKVGSLEAKLKLLVVSKGLLKS